jgi:hypothetical protein
MTMKFYAINRSSFEFSVFQRITSFEGKVPTIISLPFIAA